MQATFEDEGSLSDEETQGCVKESKTVEYMEHSHEYTDIKQRNNNNKDFQKKPAIGRKIDTDNITKSRELSESYNIDTNNKTINTKVKSSSTKSTSQPVKGSQKLQIKRTSKSQDDKTSLKVTSDPFEFKSSQSQRDREDYWKLRRNRKKQTKGKQVCPVFSSGIG